MKPSDLHKAFERIVEAGNRLRALEAQFMAIPGLDDALADLIEAVADANEIVLETAPPAWRDFTPTDARYCAPSGTKVEVQVDDREYRHQFEGTMIVGSPQWRSHVGAGTIVRWRPCTEQMG